MKPNVNQFLADGASSGNLVAWDGTKFAPIAASSTPQPIVPSVISSVYERESPFWEQNSIAFNANEAIYIPVRIKASATVKRIGTTVSGNVDVGIYDAGGTRLVSSGSTSQSGTSATQYFDIGDTALTAGLHWMAIAGSSGTGQIYTHDSSFNPGTGRILYGLKVEASAFPLPATATFSDPALTDLGIPMMALLLEA